MKHAMAITIVLLATLACTGGCKGSPTRPTSAPPPTTTAPTPVPSPPTVPPNGETFHVSGRVTDEQGGPMIATTMTMRYWLGGRIGVSTALTDTSGTYAVTFTSNPWSQAGGRGAARAEIITDGYDWYYRTVMATGADLVENFRLHRIRRFNPGESIVVPVTRDDGDCLGWLYSPCGRARVMVSADGNLTIEAVPLDGGAALPQIEACCLNGDERYGNPVTLPVHAGSETWVEVGQTGSTVLPSATVLVKASLQPF
jgi:hypothetical protein